MSNAIKFLECKCDRSLTVEFFFNWLSNKRNLLISFVKFTVLVSFSVVRGSLHG